MAYVRRSKSSYLWGAASEVFLKHAASLCSSHLAFSSTVSWKSKWCNHTVVPTQLQLERISVLFYQRSDYFHIVVNLSVAFHEPYRGLRSPHPKRNLLNMTLKYIWWQASICEDLESEESIILHYHYTQRGATCHRVQSMGQIDKFKNY